MLSDVQLRQFLQAFLSRNEVQALVDAPDSTTWYGRRDRVLLKMLYNTGARVSELIGIHVDDLELDITPSVRLHGKERKQRTVPLWKETAVEIRRGSHSPACKRLNLCCLTAGESR
ncbi:tyrosine-type recombinase/integrase [Burkholderia metallica]|uniref:tyrosine-type recombinase/integrase n=1 Tax=Burkholderia metallica TaxID=488729 RepID=UPI00299D7C16|nr:tyrosine-type recombinase/integrase [Burkholderia metallica]